MWSDAILKLVGDAPRGRDWYFYYLYSVEKAMEICGVEKLGTREWWREGAPEIYTAGMAERMPYSRAS